MATIAVVLFCVSLPVILSYGGKTSGANGRPLIRRTAQNVHLRRRLQHAACGISIAAGYKWVTRDAWTGEQGFNAITVCFARDSSVSLDQKSTVMDDDSTCLLFGRSSRNRIFDLCCLSQNLRILVLYYS